MSQNKRVSCTGGGMFVFGIACTVIGVNMPNQTLLIAGIVFLVCSAFGFMVAGFSFGAWKPPEVIGVAAPIRAISSADRPKSESAVWRGDQLEVSADQAATIELFDVALADVDGCKLAYRFQIQTDDLQGAVYPEMWCHIRRRGKFFSRGVDNKISGNNDWVAVEIPFYLKQRQHAHELNLNLVFEGPGRVRMKGIAITSAPVA